MQGQRVGACGQQDGVDGDRGALAAANTVVVLAAGIRQRDADAVAHGEVNLAVVLVVGKRGTLLDGVFVQQDILPHAAFLVVATDQSPLRCLLAAEIGAKAIAFLNGDSNRQRSPRDINAVIHIQVLQRGGFQFLHNPSLLVGHGKQDFAGEGLCAHVGEQSGCKSERRILADGALDGEPIVHDPVYLAGAETDVLHVLSPLVFLHADDGHLANVIRTRAAGALPFRVEGGKQEVAVVVSAPAPVDGIVIVRGIAIQHKGMATLIVRAGIKDRTAVVQLGLHQLIPLAGGIRIAHLAAHRLVVTHVLDRLEDLVHVGPGTASGIRAIVRLQQDATVAHQRGHSLLLRRRGATAIIQRHVGPIVGMP